MNRPSSLIVVLVCSLLVFINSLEFGAAQMKSPQDQAQFLLEVPQPYYIAGTAIPIVVDYQFPGSDAWLMMGGADNPQGLQLFLIDENGKALAGKLTSDQDIGLGAPPGVPPQLDYDGVPVEAAGGQTGKPGGRVRLRYDLDRLFIIPKPGHHKLHLRYRNQQVAEANINVLELSAVNRKSITAGCNLTYNPKIFRGGDGAVTVICEVAVGKIEYNGEEHWFTTVSRLQVGKETLYGISAPIKVPKHTTVESIRLDFQWKLWCVLESGEQSGLLVWDLISQKGVMVLPWSKDKIAIGSTPRGADKSQKLVFAGIPGKVSVNTLNLEMLSLPLQSSTSMNIPQ